MNDVFEHLTDPVGVLRDLRGKLKPGGRVFIDTPCIFWLYYAFKHILPCMQAKVLRGTVDADHQQIWSTRSFNLAAEKAGLSVMKMRLLSEYTQGASFYMDNMGIRNRMLRLAGCAFIAAAPLIARNKIMAVLH